jgi:drug/metabolite transporter (DMT)-like permease
MERRRPKIPRPVVAGLCLAVVLDTAIQIAWKLAVSGIPAGASMAATLAGALASPYFYAAMLAFGAQMWNWLRVLARADLSFAQPFTALSYISVLTLSSHSLHESLSLAKVSGVGLILVGVFLISRTPSLTGGVPATPAPDDRGPRP